MFFVSVSPVQAQEGPSVSIDKPTLSCGDQTITVSGTSNYDLEIMNILVSSTDMTPQKTSIFGGGDWSISNQTFSVGSHTITAIVTYAGCETDCQVLASDTWDFTIEACEEEESTTESGTGGTPPTFAGSSTEAPQCGMNAPTNTGANFHVYRNGPDAILKWWPTGGNKANIYYKQVGSSVWQYALRDIDNTGLTEIHCLGTLDIVFALQQANGCAGGSLTQYVVDSGTNGWMLFR